jgi:DNA helicase-2/ATP-dependent DNA helicase PcrA
VAVPPPLRRRGQDLNPLQHALLEEIRGGRTTSASSATTARRSTAGTALTPSTLVDVEQRFRGVTVVALTGQLPLLPQIVRAGAAALAGAAMTDDTESRAPTAAACGSSAASDEHDEARRRRAVGDDLVQRHGSVASAC